MAQVTNTVIDDAMDQHGRVVAWADYNNDGKLDLLVCNELTNYLFRNDGSGSFTSVLAPDPTPSDPTLSKPPSNVCVWADLDG